MLDIREIVNVQRSTRMDPQVFVRELELAREWFDRSTRCLGEEDSIYAPTEGAMTVAQQVAHVAQTIDWFIEGAFRPEGFDLDFAGHAREVQAVTSLTAARAWLDRAVTAATAAVSSRTPEELEASLPPGPVMGGQPRSSILGGICDHTAHHRGALTVYSRLRGHVPPMPYMDA